MDNLTHALVGASLAELALPKPALRGPRRLFLAAGVIASNLPDLDIAYTGITPAPLGYLLHHRGHTHTLAGLAALAALIALVSLVPPLRRAIRAAGPRRFAALVAVSLVLHIVLDSWNTYGVHPFAPFDPRWLYGDAIFIFEPWLWMLLGIAAAANAVTRAGRVLVAVIVIALPCVLAAPGVIPVAGLLAVLGVGAGLAWGARSLAPRTRALSALAAVALFVAGMFGVSAMARSRTGAALVPGGRLVEVIVNPNPGWPVCWDVIAIEEDAGALRLRRGTLSLVPSWQAPDRCPSHRIEGGPPAADGAALAWHFEARQPLDDLREAAARDCWARAWLQFGRVPFIREGTIADLRYHSDVRANFSAMALAPGERPCPAVVTSWALPRADVLGIP